MNSRVEVTATVSEVAAVLGGSPGHPLTALSLAGTLLRMAKD